MHVGGLFNDAFIGPPGSSSDNTIDRVSSHNLYKPIACDYRNLVYHTKKCEKTVTVFSIIIYYYSYKYTE